MYSEESRIEFQASPYSICLQTLAQKFGGCLEGLTTIDKFFLMEVLADWQWGCARHLQTEADERERENDSDVIEWEHDDPDVKDYLEDCFDEYVPTPQPPHDYSLKARLPRHPTKFGCFSEELDIALKLLVDCDCKNSDAIALMLAMSHQFKDESIDQCGLD